LVAPPKFGHIIPKFSMVLGQDLRYNAINPRVFCDGVRSTRSIPNLIISFLCPHYAEFTRLRGKEESHRILAERDILLHVRSPFIALFFFSFTGVRNLFLVTECVPGSDLFSVLEDKGAFADCDARIYAAQIVAGLQSLRSNGVIHRDLKPHNVMIDGAGHIKLPDFALSQFGRVDGCIDQARVGTPERLWGELFGARCCFVRTPHGLTSVLR
jgi:serine/threonine protein kinase